MNIEIEEGERQMLLMAIAHLANRNPGWDYALSLLAVKMEDKEMFEKFKDLEFDVMKELERI